jgi:hypothetical protein
MASPSFALVMALCMFTADDRFRCFKTADDKFPTLAACEDAGRTLPKTRLAAVQAMSPELNITEQVAFAGCVADGDEIAKLATIEEIESKLMPELKRRQDKALGLHINGK